MVTDGSLVYRSQQLGSQTLLGDMMNALSEAQGSKAPIARFADKVAAVFVPTVIGIALLTFFTHLVASTRYGDRVDSWGCGVSDCLSLCLGLSDACGDHGGHGQSREAGHLV